jgi:SWI/SNF-related matrix-associated actin-dependent regulator 1 of chromatin subfamily A
MPVELDDEYKEQYDVAARDLANYLRSFTNKKSPEIQKALAAEKLVRLNVLRQVNEKGKVAVAEELIDSIVDSGEKVLIFGCFVAPLETLKERYGDAAVIITGQTPIDDRKVAVDKFQNDPRVKVFLGGMLSAGTGITLTAASNVIMLGYSFNPADHEQSLNRAHRPGATYSALNIYQLTVKDSIDEDMKELLEKKQEVFDQVIEGKVVKKSKDAMDKAVQRVLKNY